MCTLSAALMEGLPPPTDSAARKKDQPVKKSVNPYLSHHQLDR